MKISTIGGNINKNSGGLRGLKYGVTRDYVLALEVVLANGDIIRTGGKPAKDVAGYDLTRLIIGSEGTLGIITEATLKLIPMPESKTVPFMPIVVKKMVQKIWQNGIFQHLKNMASIILLPMQGDVALF